MNIPFFSKLFQRYKKEKLQTYDSIIIQHIKTIAKEKNYIVFQETPIFHRNTNITPELILFIPNCGFVIFETNALTFKQLQNNSEIKHNNSFETITQFIQEKYYDITNKEDLVFHHFLIYEQLNKREFSLLPQEIQEKLLQKNTIFFDSSLESIQQLFQDLKKQENQQINTILPYIYNQYMHLDSTIFFANEEQRSLIDTPLEQPFTNIKAKRCSGKTKTLLLKAFYEKIQNKTATIFVLTPHKEEAEFYQQKLLELIELSHITLDFSGITITTPLKFLNDQRIKYRLSPQEHLCIEQKLLKKSRKKVADIILCDDSYLLEQEFIAYLQKLQKKKKLLLINDPYTNEAMSLTHSYTADITYIKAKDARYLQILYTLLEENKTNIFIFYQNANPKDLQEEIEGFCGIKPTIIDKKKHDYATYTVALIQYDPLFHYYPNYAIFLETKTIAPHLIKHFGAIAKKGNFFLKENL